MRRDMKVHHGPLNDLAHAMAAAAGIREMPYVGEDVGGTTRMTHPLMPRSFRSRVIDTTASRDADGGPTDAFRAWVASGIANLQRTQAWDDQVPRLDGGLRPAWGAIAHPLTCLAHKLGLGGTQGTMSCDRDMYVGACAVIRDPFVISIDSDGGKPSFSVASTILPESALAACAGRPLSALFRLPECGDARIDADVAALTIAATHMWRPGVSGNPGSATRIDIELEPAPWRPFEEPPADIVVDWYVKHPLFA